MVTEKSPVFVLVPLLQACDSYSHQMGVTISKAMFVAMASCIGKSKLAALVKQCLDTKGVGGEGWEAEIDDRGAYLYALTAEDMKIIRGE